MFKIDSIYNISVQIVLCFSFFIFMIAVYLKKESFLSRILALCFYSPLFLTLCSLFSSNNTLSISLLVSGELSLITALFLITVIRLKKKHLNIVGLTFAVIPTGVFFLNLYEQHIRLFLVSSENLVITYGIISFAFVFASYKQNNENKKPLVPGVVLLFFSVAISAVTQHYLFHYFSLILRFSAYLTFSKYFAHEFYGKLINRIDKAEQKVFSINKSLNHEVKKRVIEIERINEHLVNLSKTDPLTSLMNKSAILEEIKNHISSDNEYDFSILMFDIDNFKEINDTFGHIVGDKCIKRVSLIARNSIRDIDKIGRYGGDEFIIVVPETNSTQAKYIAERLRKNVENTESPNLTVSIGIASYPHDASNAKALIAAADKAMYFSKERGKNRISHQKLF